MNILPGGPSWQETQGGEHRRERTCFLSGLAGAARRVSRQGGWVGGMCRAGPEKGPQKFWKHGSHGLRCQAENPVPKGLFAASVPTQRAGLSASCLVLFVLCICFCYFRTPFLWTH